MVVVSCFLRSKLDFKHVKGIYARQIPRPGAAWHLVSVALPGCMPESLGNLSQMQMAGSCF